MFKFTSIALTVALCGVLRCGVASPVASSSEPDLTKEINVIGKAFLGTVQAIGEYLANLVKIISSGVWQSLGKSVITFCMRVEVFVMSTAHYVEKPSADPAEDKKQFATFTAITEMWQKLDTMERMEDVISDVTAQAADNVLAQKISNNQTFKFMAERFEALLKEDQRLYEEFSATFKAKEQNIDLSKMKTIQNSKDVGTNTDLTAKIVRLAANKVFLLYTVNRITTSPKKYFILARSILELAKDPAKIDKLQNIYDVSITAAVDSFMNHAETEKDSQTNFDFAEVLFDSIQKNVDKDSGLRQELEAMKKDVSGKTVWNRSLLDIDLWPL